MQPGDLTLFEHPVALGSFRSWIRLVRRSQGIDRAYVPRLLAVALTSLPTSPLRLYERARYGCRVGRTTIHPCPVFILGHWRTGTTHLHNLLCQDKQFGYISTFQAMAPGFCLMGETPIKPLLARSIRKAHPTRETDNMPLSLDAPQEEAFALANMSPYASLHVYSLPRQAPAIFYKYALLNHLSAPERSGWTAAYLRVLRKATLRGGGKRLVLKDPANTGRIRALLQLFPDAKFIHITRGSGTSVTLAGGVDGVVVVTDNAEPRIHLLFVRSADGSYHCAAVWTSPEKNIGVFKLSLGSGLVYTYFRDDQDAITQWYFTAVDFRSGATVYTLRTRAGHGYNNWAGALFVHPAGGIAYTTMLFGLVMIRDRPP